MLNWNIISVNYQLFQAMHNFLRENSNSGQPTTTKKPQSKWPKKAPNYSLIAFISVSTPARHQEYANNHTIHKPNTNL